MKIGIIGGIVFALAIGCEGLYAVAQAQDKCAQILKEGIWETQNVSDTVVESSEYANWACNNLSNSGDGSIGYGDIKLKGSGNTSSSQCSTSNGTYKLSKAFVASSRTASKAIVDAWLGCISQAGYHVSVKYGANPQTIFIYLGRRDENRNTEKGTANIDVKPALDCGSNNLAHGISWDAKSGERLILCTRSNPKQAIDIAVNFVGGAGSQGLTIPAVKAVVYKWMPRGTGDCADADRSCSPNSAIPVPTDCNEDTLGQTAICWPADRVPSYPPPGGCGGRNLCTYKTTLANQCLGSAGSNGDKHECQAVPE